MAASVISVCVNVACIVQHFELLLDSKSAIKTISNLWGRFKYTLTSNEKAQNTKSLVKKMYNLFEEVGLIDIWKGIIPINHSLYTKIDYFLTFGKDKDKIYTCEIETIEYVITHLYTCL